MPDGLSFNGGGTSGVPYADTALNQFADSQASTVNKLATLQPTASLPDWLTTDPDKLMGELSKTYTQLPGLMGAGGIRKAYGSAISTITGQAGQVANNAAREATARAGITGGGVNSAMEKAQAMLPAYQQESELKTSEATDIAKQRNALAQMLTGVSSTMGQLRTSYLANLGNIYNQRQGQVNSFVTGEQGIGLEASQLKGGVPNNTTVGGGVGSGGILPRTGPASFPGYDPGFGPIHPGGFSTAANPTIYEGNLYGYGNGDVNLGSNQVDHHTGEDTDTYINYLKTIQQGLKPPTPVGG